MKNNIKLLDGATGTCLWEKAEKNGIKKLPVWVYNIEHPEIVEELQKEYVNAGSNIIYSNTFGANRLAVEKVADYAVCDIVKAGVEIAKMAVAGTDVKVALSIGPLSEFMEPFGDLEEEDVAEIYDEMLAPGVEAGCDCIVFETFMDLEMLRVCVETASKYNLPIYTTMTFESHGKTMMGNTPEDIADTLTPLGVAGIGINCSFGPDMAIAIAKKFADCTDTPVIMKANAGLPDESTGKSTYDANDFIHEVEPALEFVSYIGACCGSDPSFISALKAKINS